LEGFSDANIRAINKIYARPEVNEKKAAPKKKEVEPGSHIATRGYKKGDP
jgi:cytochrome c553